MKQRYKFELVDVFAMSGCTFFVGLILGLSIIEHKPTQSILVGIGCDYPGSISVALEEDDFWQCDSIERREYQ